VDSAVDERVQALADTGRPIIGISAHTGPVRIADFQVRVTLAAHKVVERVTAAGCVPVLLPPLPGIERAVDRLDGLVLPGGPDVDPALYAAAPHSKAGRVDRGRDDAELALLTAALDVGLPVFGICRGMQLLNIRLGGTLHQYIPEIVGHDGHSPEGGRQGVYGPRQVRLAAGSRIAKIIGADVATVPCHHNQAIDRIGAGLTVTGTADDGTIEVVESDDHPFVLGVQWHDEESDIDSIFRALGEAARHAAAVAPPA
jgi:putative glutamine amidotransferase